jgi:hypothetical protein
MYTKDGEYQLERFTPLECQTANCSELATVAVYYWAPNRYGLGNGAWSDYPLRYVCKPHAEEFANEHGGIKDA